MSTSTITTIGVVGAGTIGRALAAHAAKAGHHVLISNSRGPETLVDATNQFATATYEGRADIGPLTGSEWVARHLPGAHVVKAFNAMAGAYVAAEPRHAEGRQVVFYAGDDVALNADFAALIETFGFAPVYVGSLADGGRLMQLDGYLSLLHVLKQD